MHTRRVTGVAALALALVALAVPTAAATPVVVPAGGEINGEFLETILEIPEAENPWAGMGDPCMRLGNGGQVLVAIAYYGTVTCTAERGTVLMTGHDHFCSSFDPPDSEFHAVGAAAQRRCAKHLTRKDKVVSITVDGADPIDIRHPRFAAFTPLTTVQMPADNIYGVEAQPATVTAYGWNVLVRDLDVGVHVITTSYTHGGESASFEHIIEIV